MASGWIGRLVWLWGVASVAMGSVASADVPAVKPIGLVLQLEGELDHASQVEDIRRGVAKAKADGAQIVALEIHGRGWRYDIARALSEVLSAAEPPVAVFVADDALGVALSGARANGGCWAKEGLTLEKDDDAIEYAENAKEIKDDAKAWAKSDGWSVLTKHPAVRAAVLDPRKACWLIVSKSGEISTIDEEPEEAARKNAARVVEISDLAQVELRFSLEDAVALGLLAGHAGSAEDALHAAATRLNLKGLDVREREYVGKSLEERHDLASRDVQEASVFLGAAERALIFDKGGVQSGPAVKNMRGAAALSATHGAKAAIARLEGRLQESPEIQRLPAPGQSSVITKRSISATRWRTLIQRLNDRAAKLEKQANEYREAK
ncbi:MAG: hypothetical protein K2Y21_06740 [Phycisphaerales bacterium]|nr:hypothetical protein [Phycisphaerales bacterium]